MADEKAVAECRLRQQPSSSQLRGTITMARLSDLIPTGKPRVIDLVEQAGVNIRDWAHFKGGSKRAAVNPKYCYEWAFIEAGKVVVLNLWRADMRERHRSIFLDLNMRRNAEELAERRGKVVWQQRCLRMDAALQTAYSNGLPVRAIVLDGNRGSWNDSHARASRVTKRMLDPSPWAVTVYDARTGRARLTRGVATVAHPSASDSMSQIRTTLLGLARDIVTELSKDASCAAILTMPHRKGRAHEHPTGGYWATLGVLPNDITSEIWLDRITGLPEPRVWVGFRAGTWQPLSHLLSIAPFDAMSKRLIRRTGADLTDRGITRFRDPLRADQFDVLVREDYESAHFLGTYRPFSWPLGRRDRLAITREAANLIAAVCESLRGGANHRPARQKVPGPWARPDRRTERAAVRHVTRYLRSRGFTVLSRERVICGFDLHAKVEGEELHVEVKGCVGATPRFFLTRTELKTAKIDPDWRLVVVTNATRRPAQPRLLSHAAMRRTFDLLPTEWEGRVK